MDRSIERQTGKWSEMDRWNKRNEKRRTKKEQIKKLKENKRKE